MEYTSGTDDNLVLMFNNTSHRVHLDKRGSKATGVVLTDDTSVKARKEVIVAAGRLLSPKVLELSGIGQKTALSNAGIKQMSIFPVSTRTCKIISG